MSFLFGVGRSDVWIALIGTAIAGYGLGIITMCALLEYPGIRRKG